MMPIADLLQKLIHREPTVSKHDFGHVFVVGGSVGMTGSVCLTAQACLRAGAGLVTVGLPESLNAIAEMKLMEPMTLPLPEIYPQCLGLSAFSDIEMFSKKATILALGSGLRIHPETIALVKKIVTSLDIPFILDADGINAFKGEAQRFGSHHRDCIITPHEREMARFTGYELSYIKEHRKTIAQECAKHYNTIVVLKGHHTIVASPDGDYYVNDTGNPGLAKAGTGDVLTGIISAFYAQGLSAFEAAKLGVWVHGRVADHLVEILTPITLLASDLIEYLHVALTLTEHRDTLI